MNTTQRELCQYFEAKLSDSVLESLESICTSLSLSPDDLFYKWESYSSNIAEAPSEPEISYMAAFRLFLQQQSAAPRKKAFHTKDSLTQLTAKSQASRMAGLRPKLIPRDLNSRAPNPMAMVTPIKARKHFDDLSSPAFGASAFSSPPTPFSSKFISTPSVDAIKFGDRLNKGQIQDVFNDQVPSVKIEKSVNSTCKVSLVPGQQTQGYRYMYEKLTEKGDLLNDRINHFAPLLAREYYKKISCQEKVAPDADGMVIDTPDAMAIDKPEILETDEDYWNLITPPMQPQQEPHFYVGRVCCDSIIDSAKLNEQSIMLEASRELGTGVRVKLNMAPLLAAGAAFCLFPGQIVGVEACNPSGRCLDVSAVFCPPDLAVPTSNAAEIKEYYPDGPGRPAHIVVAAGPFTLDDGLGFEPLEDLVSSVLEKDPPDAVILMGPFVDIQHQYIAEGRMDMSIAEIFKLHIAPKLARIAAARPNIALILIPSIRDAIMEWVAFPQPPIGSGLSDDMKRQRLVELGLDQIPQISLFPNPVQFKINEILCAVSTQDVLLSMNSAQASKGPNEMDRISQQFQHIMQQRTFYPLYPPTEQSNLDSTRALLILDDGETGPTQLAARPDLIIIPSKLKACTKQVGSTLCVNPGHLVKGKSGGTFARIVVHPFHFADGVTADDEVMEHSVADRSRVEVIRI